MRPWATALRIPTAAGVVWFKAAAPAFAHEARVIELLAPLSPGLLPRVIASTEDGWLLLEDAGLRAREHPIDWGEVMRAYVALQREATPLAGELLAAGAHDNRPGAVPAAVERLLPWLPADLARALRERLPDVEQRMERLGRSHLGPTIDHGDLHDGNVFSLGGRARIIDWGDAAVAHPFFSLTVADDDERAAYLDAWGGVAPAGELVEEAAIVEELRFLVRALNWQHVAVYGGGYAEHVVDRVRRFLDPAGSPK